MAVSEAAKRKKELWLRLEDQHYEWLQLKLSKALIRLSKALIRHP